MATAPLFTRIALQAHDMPMGLQDCAVAIRRDNAPQPRARFSLRMPTSAKRRASRRHGSRIAT